MDDTGSPTQHDDTPSEQESASKSDSVAFVPPESVADREDAEDNLAASDERAGQKESFAHKPVTLPAWVMRITKKQWIIIGAVVIVLIGGGTVFALTHKSAPAKPVQHAIAPPKKAAPPQPTTVPSTLTGLPVAPSVNKQPVTAVMIENSTFARPQSGLDQAGVVFEAIAEGGITRFVALYQDTAPTYLGPVRSVRPYYISWLDGFNAIVAHVGGSPEALQDLTSWGIRDMNQSYNGSYFTRIGSRAAPHNVYTSIVRLNALEASKGYSTSSYTGFLRKAPSPAKTPTATAINFNISYGDYNVQYQYDPTNNDYKRSEGGAPHMEVNEAGVQTQITPKVVVAMVMPNHLESDGLHNAYGTVGSGATYVFQDGIVTTGTWSKPSNTAQITFTDASGKPIRLNEGSTWLTALGSTSALSYK
jgi:hypothetical protein